MFPLLLIMKEQLIGLTFIDILRVIIQASVRLGKGNSPDFGIRWCGKNIGYNLKETALLRTQAFSQTIETVPVSIVIGGPQC